MGFRYIGSKNNIVQLILSKIKSLSSPGAHITDLMCGTATISQSLKENGYKVTAVDVMTYSFHHACVKLLLNKTPTFKGCENIIKNHNIRDDELFAKTPYEEIIQYLNELKPIKGYFFREFSPDGKPANSTKSRKYFTSYNAQSIDAIRKEIFRLKENTYISEIEHSLLLHDLIMAGNDIANIAGTYGHYLSKFAGRALDNLCLKPTVILPSNNNKDHKVIKGYAEEVSGQINCDLCYIDPPYMKRQYAANYHILETLAREDEPEAIGVSGLRPWRDQYSNFCSKLKIRNAFDKIFTNMNSDLFLISYSEEGLLKRDELFDLFSNYGNVEVDTFDNKRFKSHNRKSANYIEEYLFTLYKK